MAKSNLLSIDKALDKKVREKVGEEVSEAASAIREELGLDTEVEEEGTDQYTTSPGTPSTISNKQAIKRAFNTFPSSEGFYGKIWKVRPEGGWEPKEYTVTAPETIPDLEQYIVSLVHEKGWGEGKYQVQIRNYDKRQGFQFNQPIIVGEYTPQEKSERAKHKASSSSSSSESPWVDPVDAGMRIMDKVLQTSKAMTPAPQPQMDMVRVAEIQASTFKSGVELAKESMKGSATQTDSASSIVQLISALKDIFKPIEPPKQPTILETLTLLKELGLVSQGNVKDNETSMLEKLKLFKEGLGLKYAHEVDAKVENPMKMIENVGTLITALRPLINPEAGPTSTLQLVLEAFGKYGGPLFETIRDFALAKKMEIEYRMNPNSLAAPPPAIRRPTMNPSAQPTAQPTPQNGGKSQVNILVQIADIVRSGDQSKFQFLRETIYGFIGPQWIQGLISGEVSVDYIVTLSKMQFGDAFDNEQSKMYLYKFVSWLREQVNKSPSSTSPSSQHQPDAGVNVSEGITAKCQSCGTEWDLTEQEWAESKICDNCKSPLTRILVAEQPDVHPMT